MKILMVLTSHDQLGSTGQKTGFWVEEFAAPYYVFKDAGAAVTVASPAGGKPPIDPKSSGPDAATEATKRFEKDADAQKLLENTRKLSDLRADDFDGIFYPGGHGPMWDLVDDPASIRLIESFWAQQKPVAAVCHGPAALVRPKTPEGAPIIQGRNVTGFTNTEEGAVGLLDVVPFRLEDRMKEQGGQFSRAEDWSSYAVQDGLLVTGQNPASSEETAEKLLGLLRQA